MPQRQAGDIGATYQDAPTKSINVGGTRFVYRRLGADAGVPVIFLHHLGAVLDNWDPRVVDASPPSIQWSLSTTAVSALRKARRRTP